MLRRLNIQNSQSNCTCKNVFMIHGDLDLHTGNLILCGSLPSELLYQFEDLVQSGRIIYVTFITCLRKRLCISMGDYERVTSELERK